MTLRSSVGRGPRRGWMLVCLLATLLTAPAAYAQQAVWNFDTNQWDLPGNVTSPTLVLSDVPEGGARIGDKVASLFALSILSQTGDPVTPTLGDLAIRGFLDEVGFLGIKIEFNGGVSAFPGEQFSASLSFRIDADNPFQIMGIGLSLDALGASNGGTVELLEEVFDPGDLVTPVGSISTYFDGASMGLADTLTGFTTFSPLDSVIVSKTLTLDATAAGNSVAQMSRFTQTFRQVPEPGTLVLAAAGLLMVVGPRRRSPQ